MIVAMGNVRRAATPLLLAALLLAVPGPAVAAPPKSAVTIYCFVKRAKVEVNPLGAPAGARVTGTIPESGPLVLQLPPGRYAIRVFERGYAEFTDTFEVLKRKPQELEADLIPVAGIVTVTANVSQAKVAVDGKLVGSTPFDQDIRAGKHEIMVYADGYQPFRKTYDIKAGKRLPPIVVNLVPMPAGGVAGKQPIYKKWWFWTIIGAVAVGGAVTAGVLAAPKEGKTRTFVGQNVIRFP